MIFVIFEFVGFILKIDFILDLSNKKKEQKGNEVFRADLDDGGSG